MSLDKSYMRLYIRDRSFCVIYNRYRIEKLKKKKDKKQLKRIMRINVARVSNVNERDYTFSLFLSCRIDGATVFEVKTRTTTGIIMVLQ